MTAISCGPHARRIPPQVHAATALVTGHTCRSVDAVCEATLNNWLDNADDDPELEPADIVWLDAQA